MHGNRSCLCIFVSFYLFILSIYISCYFINVDLWFTECLCWLDKSSLKTDLFFFFFLSWGEEVSSPPLLSHSLTPSLCHSLPPSVSVYMWVFMNVCCVWVVINVYLCMYLGVSVHQSMCLSVCLFICLCICLYLSVFLFIGLCLCMSTYLTNVCLSVWYTIYFSLSMITSDVIYF